MYCARPFAPCKGCKDRTIEPRCHISCKKYLKFLEENEKYREAKAIVEPTCGCVKHEKRRKNNIAWRVLTKQEI